VAGSCEDGYETSDTMKSGQFRRHPSDCISFSRTPLHGVSDTHMAAFLCAVNQKYLFIPFAAM
jgi:hypothetical protein